MSTIWLIGWIFTGAYDDIEYGFMRGLWLGFMWPIRLAEILKQKEKTK